LCILLVNTPLDVLKRDAGGRLRTGRKEQLQIQGIVCDGMSRILAALRTLEPRIDIPRSRTGHILPEAWLPSEGKASIGGHEGS
jgi:hypothetical protein